MELGIQTVGPYDRVREVAGIVEDAGAAAIALADHYLYGTSEADYAQPVYDSLVQAAALARDTSRVEIVMLVSPITFRHPAVYAKSITTIDEISNGRFVFGLGTGWHDDEHDYFGIEYPDMATRFAWLEDSLGYLRVFLDDPTRGYEGTRWSLRGFDARPRARDDLRLLVGGGGAAKTPALVGRFGDEYNLYHHDADGIGKRLEVMRTAAEQAGRDPDSILISTCYPMIGGADESEIDEFLGEYAANVGQTADAVRQRFADRIPMETWDIHAERLAEFANLGFERTYLQLIGHVPWATHNALKSLGT